MNDNLKGELAVMDSLGTKPNYTALGKQYGMDPRTVKKYHNGYEGRAKTRNKGSKLDAYKAEIIDKFTIRRITVQGVYEFMVKKYSVSRIGTYSNFNKYVKRNNLKPKSNISGHPRYEKEPGVQGQVDWKEDIRIANKYGELFTINILHIVLKFSRFSFLNLSIQKRFDDVSRGLINGFRMFGGVPKELLFDNMSTVANINTKPKKPTDAISQLSKDFGFKVRLCRTRTPETKGTVEAKNKVLDWIRAYEGEFETLEELAQIVETINKDMNISINQETQMSPTALFYKEKEYLKPLPNQNIIDTYLTPNKYKVSNESLIRYGTNKYSVDPKLIGEEVTVDVLDDKLYIYYNGKFETFHPITGRNINYSNEHYKKLMNGKAKEEDMNRIVNENLEMMDKLLEQRTVEVSEIAATKSADALIAYINQSEYGRWVINHYTHISATDRLIFIKGMNEVLPYIANREKFIANIKFSMKENFCKDIAFDCWVNDLMAMDKNECILTEEGFKIIKEKYSGDIDDFIKDMTIEYEKNEKLEQERYQEFSSQEYEAKDIYTVPDEDELLFM